MPAPCTVCRSADSSQRKFLLACIQCTRTWHHRCHRPVVTDKELVNLIKLFNARGPNAPKRFEWTCAACLKGKAAAAASSGSTSTETPRTNGASEKVASTSGSATVPGSSLDATRPQQVPVAVKSTTNSIIRSAPPPQGRKQPSTIKIDDDDDDDNEIQLIEDDDEIEFIKNPSATTGATSRAPAAQPPHPQSQPQARPQSQTQAPVPAPTSSRPPLGRSVKSTVAQPPRPQAAPVARLKSNPAPSKAGPSTVSANASRNVISPSLTSAPPARVLEGALAPPSRPLTNTLPTAPASWPQVQVQSQLPPHKTQPFRPQQAAKSAKSTNFHPQAAKKTTPAKAPVPPPQPTPTSTPGPSAPARTVDDRVSFPLRAGQTMNAPTGAAAAYSPAPSSAPRKLFGIITENENADEDEELDVDELDVDEDEDMLPGDQGDARAAPSASKSKAGPPRPSDNARAPPVSGPSSGASFPRRLPEWINARTETSNEAAAQDMWARAAQRRRAIPAHADTNTTRTASGNASLSSTARHARKAFKVVHKPAGRSSVSHPEDKDKGKGKEKAGSALVPARNSNLVSAAPFLFTADAWMLKKMAELRV